MQYTEVDLSKHPECKHLGLVVTIARGYMRRRAPGIDLDDLIDAGWMGLHRAWEKYTAETPAEEQSDQKFAAYATGAIRQWIKDALRGHGDFHMPRYIEMRWWKAEMKDGQWTAGESQCLDMAFKTKGLQKQDLRAVEAVAAKPDNRYIDRDEIDFALRCLEQREQEIIRMRFGLQNYRPMTLDEVGRKLGITRERVRQIENKSLSRMRRRLSA